MTEREARPVGLEEMLEARERRAALHRAYVREYACPALLFTLNIPGPVKTGPKVRACFEEGFQALIHALEEAGIPLRNAEAHQLVTGPEGCLAADGDARALKRLAVELEERHPQGRLFDIDLLDANGSPVSRADVGLEERTCFLCGESAKACGRSRRHSLEELARAVEELLERGRETL